MTDLSPAAQSQIDSDKEWQEFLSECLRAQAIAEREGYEFPYYLDDKAQELKARLCAAALVELADQVVPANGSRRNNEIRAEILAIAAELERTE